MTQLRLEINGVNVIAETEPRTHLADFLREGRGLTGTHIGCEHGVCGACTVLIDGVPARSCITFAVACEAAQITTIEGLHDDPIIVALREAFSANHALQCGYCTPAMLISCWDILKRLPDADEARIRLELSGNLCRCTGYVGIVRAIKAVQQKLQQAGTQPIMIRNRLGPVGANPSQERPNGHAVRARAEAPARLPSAMPVAVNADQWHAVETEGTQLQQSFRVPFARDIVWNYFSNLERVARCMPGARLTSASSAGDRAEGEVNVRLGPIVSAFAGLVEVERDSASFIGRIRGSGRDVRSGSNARAVISYRVKALAEHSTEVDITTRFLLTGALAQFGRLGLVKDIADHLTQAFAANLQAALSNKPVVQSSGSSLNAAALAWLVFRKRIRALFAQLRLR